MFAGLSAYSNWGLWFLQIVTGIIFIVHGVPKMKNPSGIASAYHAPAVVGFLQGLVELLGGIALIISFQVHWVALLFGIIMLGAIYFKLFVWKTGFWAHDKTGWEFDLLLLAVFVMLLTR